MLADRAGISQREEPHVDCAFIIGTERSGSNLLRVILDAHPDVTVPHPPHVLRYLSDIHGESTEPERLVDDMLAFVEHHIHPWEDVPERSSLLERVREDPTPVGAFLALYDLHAAHLGSPAWACKSTFVVHHTAAILERRPRARFVWLVRDPRDVAASSMASVFNPYDPLLTAALWDAQQREAMAAHARLGDDVVMRLHYEDLLASPELTTARICDHLGIRLHGDMLAFHERSRAKHTATLSSSWKNASQPVLRGNSGKWRTRLDAAQVARVEGVCRETMEALDYLPESDGQAPPAAAFVLARARDWAMRFQGEWRSLRHDEIHWRRWRRRARVARLRLREALR